MAPRNYVHHNTLIDGPLYWSHGMVQPASKNFQFFRNVFKNSRGSPHKMCQSGELANTYANSTIDKNLYINPPNLIMDNDWCPASNDADTTKWKNILAFDLNGIFTTTSPLIGSKETIGIKSDSPYYLLYGHQY